MIHYLVGDATDPQVGGNKIIAHVCNDVGGWGRGFVLSLSKRWPEPEHRYRNGQELTLGTVLFVSVSHGSWLFDGTTYVANMIGQHGVRHADDGTPPIRYDAIEACLARVRTFIEQIGSASVHMPRIGCGLAGGKWSVIEPIIERTLHGVDVYVYDFDTGDKRTVPWNK